MKYYSTLLLPLITTGLLSACATSQSSTLAAKPHNITEQDIPQLAQQGQLRALEARSQPSNDPEVLAGEAPIEMFKPIKPPTTKP